MQKLKKAALDNYRVEIPLKQRNDFFLYFVSSLHDIERPFDISTFLK